MSQIELSIEGQKATIYTEEVGNQVEIKVDESKTAYVHTEMAAELGMTIRITERVRSDTNLEMKVKEFNLSLITRFNSNGKPVLLEQPIESKARREIAVFSIKNIWLNQKQSLKTTDTDLRLGSIQIDYNANEPANFLTILSVRHNAAKLASNDTQAFLSVKYTQT